MLILCFILGISIMLNIICIVIFIKFKNRVDIAKLVVDKVSYNDFYENNDNSFELSKIGMEVYNVCKEEKNNSNPFFSNK